MPLSLFLSSLVSFLLLFGSPGADAAGRSRIRPKTLTQQQKDEIMALSFLETNSEAANRAAAIGNAVRYQNRKYTGVPDLREIGRVQNFSYGNPLSSTTYRAILNPDLGQPKLLDQTLKETADRVYTDTEPLNLRNSIFNRSLDLATGAGALMAPLYVSPGASIGIGVGNLIFDFSKDLAIDEDEGLAKIIPMKKREAVSVLAHMQDEIRTGSVEGKAYAGYFKSLLKSDPTESSDDKAPVQLAMTKLEQMRSQKLSEESILKTEELQGTIIEVKKGVENIRRTLSSEEKQNKIALPTNDRANIARNLQNYRGGLMIAGYLMDISGDKKGARIAFGVADMSDKVSTFITQAENMAPAMLAAGYVGVAVAAVSLLQSASEPASPYPQIFAMLEQISRQLNDFREEMITTLGRMDNRLGNLLLANLDLTDAVKRDTEVLRVHLNEIQAQLREAQNVLVNQNISLAEMFMGAEDRGCLRVLNRRLMEPQPDFLACQQVYYDRATKVSRNAISNANLRGLTNSHAIESLGPFPFASHYQALQDSSQYSGEPIANPSVWFAAVDRYLALLRSFPDYLNQIDLGSDLTSPDSRTLDPMIDTGEQIKKFVQSLAFEDENRFRFKGENIGRGLRDLQRSYEEIDVEISKDLRRNGLNPTIDITRPSARQTGRLNFDHRFLAHQGVPYCAIEDNDKTVVHFINTKSWSWTDSGLAHGIDGLYRSPPGVDGISPHLDHDFKRIPAITFQPDQTILQALGPTIRLWEMLWPGSPLEVCLKRVDVSYLEMEPKTGIQANVSFHFDVSAPINGKNTLVASLFGVRHVRTEFFNYMYDSEHRSEILADRIMNAIRGRYGEFMNRFSGGIYQDGFDQMAAIVDQRLESQRKDIRAALADVGRSERLEQLRANLIMTVSIGMNLGHVKVDQFVRDLQNHDLFPTAEEFIDQVVLKGKDQASAIKGVEDSFTALDQILTGMEDVPVADLLPSTLLLDVKLNQLRVLKDMRVRQQLETAKH